MNTATPTPDIHRDWPSVVGRSGARLPAIARGTSSSPTSCNTRPSLYRTAPTLCTPFSQPGTVPGLHSQNCNDPARGAALPSCMIATPAVAALPAYHLLPPARSHLVAVAA